jgi:hypothetical protein
VTNRDQSDVTDRDDCGCGMGDQCQEDDLPRTTGLDIDWEAGCWEGTRRDWEREQMDRAGEGGS